YTDQNDTGNTQSFLAPLVRFITLPAAGSGTLTILGGAVDTTSVPPRFYNQTELATLRFVPAQDKNDGNLARPTFTFVVKDGGGTADGGVDVDSSANTMTISVLSVADPPVGVASTVTATEDTDYSFKSTDFGFSDSSDNPPDTLAAVYI